MTLGDITAPKVDQSGPPPTGDFTYVDISSIDNRAKRIIEPRRLPVNAAPSRARQRLASGDVLVSMTRPNLNAVALVPSELDGAIGSTGFHVLRSNERTEPRWLYYAVQNRSFVQAMSEVVQGALYPAVRPKDIRGFEVDPPPLPEQRRIVTELEKQFSRLDEAVAGLQRVKANLKRYKAAILKSAVTGRLVPTEADLARREGRSYETGTQLLQRILETRRSQWQGKGKYKEPVAPETINLPELPEGWMWATVGQLGVIKGGKRLPAGHTYAQEPTPYPYIRVTDFASYGVEQSGLVFLKPETRKEIERYTISAADVYISIAGTIGMVGQVPEDLSGANLTENAAKITDLLFLCAPYLVFWLASPSGTEFIADSTIATTQAKLALFRIEQIAVPLPPLPEQHRIVAEVDRLLSIAREAEAEVEANLKRAQGLRQAILSKAFSGGVQ